MSRSKKLELMWVGKEDQPLLEPRILVEETEKSFCASARKSDDIFDNILIHGDNLLALKSLDSVYAGKIKCIYIDPPYNTGSAFEHYDDGLEHSLWLSLMRDRIKLLHSLLSNDGLFFAQIDDNEVAYFTVLLDEIFGRRNRVNIVAVKMSEATGVKMTHATKRMPKQKEFILVYSKGGSPKIKPIRIPRETWNDEYKEVICNISEDDLEIVKEILSQDQASKDDVATVNALLNGAFIKSLSTFFREKGIKDEDRDQWKWSNAWRIIQAVGAGSLKERAIASRTSSDISAVLSARGKLSIFKTNFDDSSRDPRIRILFADKYLTYNPGDFWADIKTTGGVGEEGGVYFPKGKKPEALIERIIGMCTEVGDLVLDSFGGSGTTGAVAHKMRRRWIMIELGDHANSHILPRLRSVIDGTDKSGVTGNQAWKGGGGFRFYKLAPSLLEKDRWGNWIISKEYNPEMLAEAMCKHMGYSYEPSQDPSEYWNHGYSSERDFIFVTTNALTHEMLEAISYDVGPDRHLLICCKAFSTKRPDAFQNLTLKRIPHAILGTCEWGRDDYSLKIASLPEVDHGADEPEPVAATKAAQARTRKYDQASPGLFDAPSDAEG